MTDRKDIVDVIKDEHATIAELFARLERATSEDKPQALEALVATLASHEAAEQAIVHRALRDEVPGSEDLYEHVVEEETSAEEMLAAISDQDVSDPAFAENLVNLRNDVLHHATHEENEEFPLLREHLDEDRRVEMAEQFVKLRGAGPTRAHPNTPQNPEARGAFGPIIGMFDRARDAVREAMRN